MRQTSTAAASQLHRNGIHRPEQRFDRGHLHDDGTQLCDHRAEQRHDVLRLPANPEHLKHVQRALSAPRARHAITCSQAQPPVSPRIAGDAAATVSWAAPTSTGASAITGYTVWCSVDGGTYTQCATARTTSASVTGAYQRLELHVQSLCRELERHRPGQCANQCGNAAQRRVRSDLWCCDDRPPSDSPR